MIVCCSQLLYTQHRTVLIISILPNQVSEIHKRVRCQQMSNPRKRTTREHLEKGREEGNVDGERRSRQLKTELDGVEWSVAYDPLGVTRA